MFPSVALYSVICVVMRWCAFPTSVIVLRWLTVVHCIHVIEQQTAKCCFRTCGDGVPSVLHLLHMLTVRLTPVLCIVSPGIYRSTRSAAASARGTSPPCSPPSLNCATSTSATRTSTELQTKLQTQCAGVICLAATCGGVATVAVDTGSAPLHEGIEHVNIGAVS